MSQRSDALWQVIKIAAPFIPAAGPYVAIAEQVWPAVRAVFVKEGGNAADFDALMAETRRNIDLLANPGHFFGPRHDDVTNTPPAPSVAPQQHRIGEYGTVLATRPRAIDYAAGDTAWQKGDDEQYVVYRRGATVGKPDDPWHPIEFD